MTITHIATCVMSFQDRPTGPVGSDVSLTAALSRALERLAAFSERWSERYVEMRVEAVRDER
jgi:hypothetical protein